MQRCMLEYLVAIFFKKTVKISSILVGIFFAKIATDSVLLLLPLLSESAEIINYGLCGNEFQIHYY